MTNIFETTDVALAPSVIATAKIENLSNVPNREKTYGGDGMTADDLKKQFDKIGVYLASRYQNLLAALKSADAGASVGIKGFDGAATTIKEMLTSLTETTGAALIGTARVSGGVNQNVQEALDELSDLIESYELDDIADMKTELDFVEATGSCERLSDIEADITDLFDRLSRIKTLLSVDENETATTRIADIEEDVSELQGKIGAAGGTATLNAEGKLAEEVDAAKITSGILPLSVLPDGVKERLVEVNSLAEMYALTDLSVQDGDIVVVKNGDAENVDAWYKVVDGANLSSAAGYRKVTGGTTAVAMMAKEYDANYTGGNSIAEKLSSLSGAGRTTENIKSNADNIASLSGVGRTTESVKENADNIASLAGVGRTTENVKSNADKIASLTPLRFSSVSVAASDFVSDETYAKYPYRAAVPLTSALSSMIPDAVFSLADAIDGNYAPIAESYDGGIYLYAKQPPSATLVLPKITLWRETV